jgi:hypothetical protein
MERQRNTKKYLNKKEEKEDRKNVFQENKIRASIITRELGHILDKTNDVIISLLTNFDTIDERYGKNEGTTNSLLIGGSNIQNK